MAPRYYIKGHGQIFKQIRYSKKLFRLVQTPKENYRNSNKQFAMQKIIEKYLLPISMAIGILFHKYIALLSPATPYLLLVMLFITYSRLSLGEIRFNKLHYWLLAVQYLGSIIIYLLLRNVNETLAQATMICVLAPTATSAPVVVGLLGGNIASATAFTLLSNLLLAILAPLYLTLIGNANTDIPFITSFIFILKKVVPILIVPFLLAVFLQKASPKLHSKVKSMQIVSFYVWAVALTIVLGNVTSLVINKSSNNYSIEIAIGLASLIICVLQFISGRAIGKRFGQTIAGGQGMGQKNTILAIWLTQTYLNPIASLGPGLYVAWQNIVNSYQIWKKKQSE